MLEAHNSILAVDIGGTNIRAGVVRLEPIETAGRGVAALTRFAALTRARETAPIPARSDADRPAPAGSAAPWPAACGGPVSAGAVIFCDWVGGRLSSGVSVAATGLRRAFSRISGWRDHRLYPLGGQPRWRGESGARRGRRRCCDFL